jgi:hypothetical protein
MKKRNTYREYADGNFLIRTEEFDSDQKLVKDIGYDRGNIISEIVYTYDNSGNLISEIQTNEDGVTATFYEFYSNNKIANQKQLFDNEVYEEMRYYYTDNSTTIETHQDDEIIAKLVKTEYEDKSSSSELFDLEGKLSEKHLTKFNAASNSFETEVFNEENKLIAKTIEKADEKGRLKETIYLNEEGKLYKLQILNFVDDKITEIHSKDYYATVKETICRNEFDEQGRLIGQKLYNAAEELLQNCRIEYNEKGDIIEESSIFNGGFNTVAGILNNGQTYRYIYEIEY